jgi:hypothetical protein
MSSPTTRPEVRRRDPWPSAVEAWMDPPWLMTGRSLTAWFTVPWQTIETSLSADLRPAYSESIRIRLRFYDLAYTALSDDRPGVTAPRTGHFREAVFGVPARLADTVGEVSVCMWADGSDYLAWGREVFGWPVLPGSFELEGAFWDGGTAPGTTAKMNSAAGSLALADVKLSAGTSPASPAGIWLTPRRRLERAGLDEDSRDVLVVRPEVRRPGRSSSGSCRVVVDLDPTHPFGSLTAIEAELEGADGFEIIVGANVLEL